MFIPSSVGLLKEGLEVPNPSSRDARGLESDPTLWLLGLQMGFLGEGFGLMLGISLRGSKSVRVIPKPYLEVHCTYNLLSKCSYNPNIGSMPTVTPDIIGL